MSGSSKKTETKKGSAKFDPWVTDASQRVFGGTEELLSPDNMQFGEEWQSALGNAAGNIGATDPLLDTGSNSLMDFVKSFDPGRSVQDYMNPYLDAVLNPALSQINETYDSRRQGLGAEAALAGAFNSSAHGVDRALMERDRAKQIADTTGGIYKSGYDTALGQKQGDIQQWLSGISGLGSMSGQEHAQDSDWTKILAGLGTQEAALPMERQKTAAQILAMLPKNTTQQGIAVGKQPDNTMLALIASKIGI